MARDKGFDHSFQDMVDIGNDIRMAPTSDRRGPSKLNLFCSDLPLVVEGVLNTYGSLLDISLVSFGAGTNYGINIWADEWRFIQRGEILLRSESSHREQIGQLHEWLRGCNLIKIIITSGNRHIRLLFENDTMIYINTDRFREEAVDIFRDNVFFFGISNGIIEENDNK